MARTREEVEAELEAIKEKEEAEAEWEAEARASLGEDYDKEDVEEKEYLPFGLTERDPYDRFDDQAEQREVYMKQAAEADKLPWQKEFKAEEMQIPHNPISGKPLTSINLITAVMHMQHIGSNDPRYIAKDQIKNLKVREGAEPLHVCYHAKDELGEERVKSSYYYNAKDIEGAPEYKPELAPSATTVKAKDGKEVGDTLVNNLSSFITALRTGQNFTPAQSKFSNEVQNNAHIDLYKNYGVNKLFAEANEKAYIAIKQFEAPVIKAPERKAPAIEQGGISM